MHIFQLGIGLLKYRLGGNRALAFAGIHEEPFALPHFCELGNLQSVAAAVQTAFRLVLCQECNDAAATSHRLSTALFLPGRNF